MLVDDFDYFLPQHLIAQHPLPERSSSRLLCVEPTAGHYQHRQFNELPSLLSAGDVLVLNDTRVVPARLLGRKASGGKIEVLLERQLSERQFLAHVRASKAPKPGAVLWIESAEPLPLQVIDREADLFRLDSGDVTVATLLQKAGQVPLPPYMERRPESADTDRYQTVYARHDGAVAAPTAGLHFDTALLDILQTRGVVLCYVTLHVGAGTFTPVRTETTQAHRMHSEWAEVSQAVCDTIRDARARGRRVVAVGTTVLRSLESAVQAGQLQPFAGDTQLFITPGYRFSSVDALITNFHLPRSTLLMLVAAFTGLEPILAAYREAIAKQYRFFSYGDAMLLPHLSQQEGGA